MTRDITAVQLKAKVDAGESFLLVDTRSPEDYETWHITGAHNVEYSATDDALRGDWDGLAASRDVDADDEIVTVCATGRSSAAFAEWLAARGYEDVTNVTGGMVAWSRVYDSVPIATDDRGVDIRQVQRRARGCLSYLVGCTETREAAVIDPTRHVDVYRDLADDAGYEITHVFDTHVHADHLSGGRELADELGVPYHLGAKAADRDAGYEFDPLEHHDVVAVGNVDVKALYTPGHTTDITSYLIDAAAVCTGDTLFVESIGRTELEFSGDGATRGARRMYDSLHRVLLSLPDAVTVLPGHFSLRVDGEAVDVTPGEPMRATVGYLRVHNRVLQLDEDAFVEHMFESLPEKPRNYETVIEANLGRYRVRDEAEANDLELGPNNCAATEESMVADGG